MRIFRDIEALPVFRNAVVTIGTFDGVHEGHLRIIAQLKEEAERIKGETVIITFDPHPRHVVAQKSHPLLLLNTLEEKTERLRQAGIHNLVITPFTPAFADLDAHAYIEDFLISKFHPHTLIIGYDHRFGKGRQGDFHLMEEYASRLDFRLIEIPGYLLNEAAISSTRIREALLAGSVDNANELLGSPYFITGTVTEGQKIGRTLGYPTANIQVNDISKLVPANGVYAVEVNVHGKALKGMMNIGNRPTVDGSRRTIEVHIFDFNEDIYGAELTIYFRKRLREEKKFSGLEELKEQLARDKAASEAVLKP